MSGRISNKIVTDGLVLYLDATNPRSYVSGSTSWYDISESLVTTNLVNGPTYNISNNVTNIIFDGTSDYGLVNSNNIFTYGTGDFTWEVFWKPDRFNNNDYLLDHGSNGGTLALDGAGYPSRYYNSTYGTSGPLMTTGFGVISNLNLWYHFVASRINNTTYLYKNGILQTSDTDNHNYPQQELNLARYGGNTNFLQGKVSIVRIYKGKGLTQSEVSQNYNVTKSRFGL